ncbi:MAG: FAD:protein FMN transferase [Eubacteriales bacterium]|nr:FAD:protein FMN transferase [Eubacteriales bacterium]
MKRILSLFCIAIILCVAPMVQAQEKFRYDFFNTFDTMISVIAFADSKAEFDKTMQIAEAKFQMYHKYFDIYHEYEGMVNLATLNAKAHVEPVQIEAELFSFLEYCKQVHMQYPSRANIAMGNMLSIWHDFRTEASKGGNAQIPGIKTLQAAMQYSSLDDLVLNKENNTVFYINPIRLDVGSIAKGYATEQVALYLEGTALSSFIINAGGNVRTGNAPQDGRNYWAVGIANPQKPSDLYETVFVKQSSIVTSGDYQRFYEVGGKRYHHIIDPTTLMPANYYRSVSIHTQNSAMADYLSTALYTMDLESGKAFVESLDGVEALWILEDNSYIATDGFARIQKSQGATAQMD